MESNSTHHLTENVSNLIEQDDPNILATSYMMYKVGDALKHFYMSILVPIGIIGNLLSFLVMIQPHKRQMSFSLYISALAVVDTIVILGASASYLNQVHGVDISPNQNWFCRLQNFYLYFAFLCSCYLLITMTFERCYSILQPHKAASFNTVKRTRIIIVCIFLFFFSYCIPYLFITGNNGRFCIPNRFASDRGLGEFYYWLSEIFLFIFPFLSLLTMNCVIIHTLRTRSKHNILGTKGQGQSEGQNIKAKHTEKQIITMLLLITFVFLALNIPTRSLVFYLNFYSANTPYYYAGLHLFYQIGEKSFYTNHGINFFLYVMAGQKFRRDLKDLFVSKKSIMKEGQVSMLGSINVPTSSVLPREYTLQELLAHHMSAYFFDN